MTYGSYLRLDELLSLQTLSSDPPEHDERLFLVIHQVYELWFAQILWEGDRVVARLAADDRPAAVHALGRIRAIVKVLVSQLDVLETMTPLEFASFREFLATASGFQSAQFREFEFWLGLKDGRALDRADSEPVRARLQARLAGPSVWDALVAHLRRTGHGQPDEVGLLESAYRTDPSAAGLCERFVDLDEGVQEWRYRHVQMVRRTIGTRTGTGGSSGAAYLRSTLRDAFPALWDVRARF